MPRQTPPAAASGTTPVAVVADSSACLPEHLLQQYRITIVPLVFLLDGEIYHDGLLSSREFYQRLESARRPPTTTAPAPGEFLDAFRHARDAGAGAVVCLTLSAAFSGTHSAALNAAELAASELPGLPVRVLDTGGLAMTHGFAVLAAARAAQAGASLEEAAAAAKAVASRASLIGALDTMRYLVRSGRVPWILHWAASILRIKPILATEGERVRSIARVRTSPRALERLLRHLEARAGPPEHLHVAVMHADAPDRAEVLSREVRRRFSPVEMLVTEFTTVMGIHTGPGFLGIAFYSDEGLPSPEPARRRQPLLERDVRLLRGALGPLPPAEPRPAFVVLIGLPGSGKSHLAREIIRRRPLALVESDQMRRALFKRPAYTETENTRLFRACHQLLEELLAAGIPALCDATNLRELHRRPLYEIA